MNETLQTERLNRYTCPNCGCSLVTVDRDTGTTPMFLACRNADHCSGRMVSAMYRGVTGPPTYEWYRPGKGEYRRLSPAMQEHVDAGGLCFRPIPPNTDPTDEEPPVRGTTYGPAATATMAAMAVAPPSLAFGGLGAFGMHRPDPPAPYLPSQEAQGAARASALTQAQARRERRARKRLGEARP